MRHDESGRRDQLWELATRQRGYFTAADALRVGYSYQAQRHHKSHGNWIPIDRGIYRLREYLALPGQETDHLVRWMLWSGGAAVASHTTALAVHDLGIANPAEVHLTVPPGFRRKKAAVVLHRATLDDHEIEDHEGFRVTTPLRAVLETAQAGIDQDVVDSAVTELLDRGFSSRRRLLHGAQEVGPRAELAIERALRGGDG
ncbi:type IV toxin-antitoxin system AbiEi family antitoxin domain-containing protein [Nocardia carnea]|uniref:Type IV toxin-antitoxin system AbiEi family antitoxin domain-containing protein n=1 Tax=Nocardia carnea TaxID=37328 RepID=A0ABW7TT01_9NOCA|nr:type IV toxin-antitoxin system AbiEi family antitoxin domain-containing protein [Nocardia carnea]